MNSLNATLVQARIRWKDPARNREHLQTLLEGSDPAQTDLIVFPETFTTGFLGDSDLPDEAMDGETVAWMQAMAAKYDAAVTGSTVIVVDGNRYNRMVFAHPDGRVEYYDKRHLFAFGGENKRYAAGEDRKIIRFRDWRINLQVCYDLRFPVWCRNRSDYDLMLLVANWPARRVHHWLALLEARAIENQSCVIGLNRVGKDGNGLQYPGRSVVFDPQGQLLSDLGDEERVQSVALDLESVKSTRSDFPFLADRDAFTLNS